MNHLVDTSSWIELIRADGQADVKARVGELLKSGNAFWCELVRLELWNGAAGERDVKHLRSLEKLVPSLEIDATTWQGSIALAINARADGLTVQATDLLIAACARRHEMDVESCDRHFERLAALKIS